MKTIKFNFHRSETIIGSLVRFRIGSYFDHVSIIMDKCVYEATMLKGTIKNQKHGIRKDVSEVISITVTDVEYDNYLKYLESRVGNRYDYGAIKGFLLNRKTQSNRGDFCSEIANAIFNYLILNVNHSSNKLISPKDFYNRLKYYEYGRKK